MLAGVNDSDEQADALIAYLVGLNVHVNLIPYNTFDESNGIRGSDANRIRSFSERLKGAGLPTTTRYSMGRDVAAACGQLAREAGGGLDQPRTVDVGPLRR
jgi:23S rRNA (adenine2503-C2)-methyltransferase